MFKDNDEFNQDIGNWDVSNGSNFIYMFSGADAFNQDIGSWNVSSGIYFTNMFSERLIKILSFWMYAV